MELHEAERRPVARPVACEPAWFGISCKTGRKGSNLLLDGLFIPCYIDAFFPEVGIATLELLERFGHEVVYPRDQT
jgi:Fe-S oxidoreductase